MINYGEEPSNQLAFKITPEAGYVEEAKQWINDNPEAWDYYMHIARTESCYGKLSPDYPVNILRHRLKVSINNSMAPILARLALEQDNNLQFRLKKSKYDPYFEVKL